MSTAFPLDEIDTFVAAHLDRLAMFSGSWIDPLA